VIDWTHPPIQARRVTRHGDLSIATMPSRNGGGFVAWAKFGDIVGMSPIDEPGRSVWVDHGATRDEARCKLLAELGLAT
jgi:hypothetical protein